MLLQAWSFRKNFILNKKQAPLMKIRLPRRTVVTNARSLELVKISISQPQSTGGHKERRIVSGPRLRWDISVEVPILRFQVITPSESLTLTQLSFDRIEPQPRFCTCKVHNCQTQCWHRLLFTALPNSFRTEILISTTRMSPASKPQNYN